MDKIGELIQKIEQNIVEGYDIDAVRPDIEKWLSDHTQKWIAVSEQEPPRDSAVLVCNNGDTGHEINMAWFNDSKSEWYTWIMYGVGAIVFTHWMPLPKHINETK